MTPTTTHGVCLVNAQRGPEQGQFTAGPNSAATWVPGLREWVIDTSTGRTGQVMRWDGTEVTLCPPDGGTPWYTTTYRRATPSEHLAARVMMLNRRGYTC